MKWNSRLTLLAAVFMVMMLVGGCAPSMRTSIDFTTTGFEDEVDFESDDTAMPGSSTASFMEQLDYQWEHQHGLVIRRGRIYTDAAYRGDFRAELTVDIVYQQGEATASSDAAGFILGIGFKELPVDFDLFPNVFKAVQYYGNHVDLTDSIKAYTVFPHMLYDTAISIEDDAIDYVSPFVKDFLPGLLIGNGLVSGENLIVLKRTGETISVEVNGALVGEYESHYLIGDYFANLLFDDFDADLPLKIGVFSGCAHITGDNDEGVFLKSLVVYADEIID